MKKIVIIAMLIPLCGCTVTTKNLQAGAIEGQPGMIWKVNERDINVPSNIRFVQDAKGNIQMKPVKASFVHRHPYISSALAIGTGIGGYRIYKHNQGNNGQTSAPATVKDTKSSDHSTCNFVGATITLGDGARLECDAHDSHDVSE